MDNRLYYLIPLAVVILAIQGIWIFLDARKRGEKYYWLWGLFGLIQFPTSLIIYLLVTRSFKGSKVDNRCPQCGQNVEDEWQYCPYCSTRLKDE